MVLPFAALLALEASCASDSSLTGGKPTYIDGGPEDGGPEDTKAEGVLLVHAAAFPAFRLCFEERLDDMPLPDSTIMPEANVVGVEVGSLVRVRPMKAPGTVYVFREKALRLPRGTSSFPSCRELLATKTKDLDYHVAGAIHESLGDGTVSVLALTGCGSKAALTDLGITPEGCGATWDATSGNLEVQRFTLTASRARASNERIPVQVFQLSRALNDFAKPDAAVEVSFGNLMADGGAELVPLEVGELFAGGTPKELTFDPSNAKNYGTWGFRIRAKDFVTDTTLATIQELSSPRDVPTSYYAAASNYALLLLGDPKHEPTLADGGANATYNPRQAVHMLAVPVIDPSQGDAGADAGVDGSVTTRF